METEMPEVGFLGSQRLLEAVRGERSLEEEFKVTLKDRTRLRVCWWQVEDPRSWSRPALS